MGEHCQTSTEWYAWDGDQLLYETRSSGGPAELSGTVGYTYGLGLDAPLDFTKQTGSTVETVVPHANWQGSYDSGTRASNGTAFGCPPGQTTGCALIRWPAGKQTAFQAGGALPPEHWYGSVIYSFRDESGLLFRRNRYYDPQTGQFTQQDPIGIAGGLNLYGFAGGDPVNFSDPFGLDPCRSSSAWTECLFQALANWGARRGGRLGGAAVLMGSAANGVLEATGVNALASAGNSMGEGRFLEGGVSLAIELGGATGAKYAVRFVGGVAARSFGRTVARGMLDLGPVLDDIRVGRGRNPHVFENRGNPLPAQANPNYYTAYDVPIPGVQGRGPARLVIGEGGEMYFTGDHYGTFVEIGTGNE